MINKQRLLDSFLEYIQIDSETGNEKNMCDRMVADLTALGGVGVGIGGTLAVIACKNKKEKQEEQKGQEHAQQVDDDNNNFVDRLCIEPLPATNSKPTHRP